MSQPDPWPQIAAELIPGTRMAAQGLRATTHGQYYRLPNGLVGLLPHDSLNFVDPFSMRNGAVDVVIVGVNPSERLIDIEIASA